MAMLRLSEIVQVSQIHKGVSYAIALTQSNTDDEKPRFKNPDSRPDSRRATTESAGTRPSRLESLSGAKKIKK